ncbi:MAG TPA: winged helix-turn-helix domain-containing protein [Candidatus Borkfalkia avicola]|uniref:Winged helix-turn-helix domain-containing protein n=1 Tax=Candidatus Borkfalkia avicola TaxID=2838503 RepID=A0A9D2D7E2_9FIRM|nr:winged helix-turn-helix domain-containing protein [Candidatus Borkfalkia avicola]
MEDCMAGKRRLAEGFSACRGAVAALGDETRAQIVLSLLEGAEGGMRACELAESVHLSRPAVSHQLRVLEEAGMVGMRCEGTKLYYYMRANVQLWGELSALFSEIYDTVRRAEEEGYPSPCRAGGKEEG